MKTLGLIIAALLCSFLSLPAPVSLSRRERDNAELSQQPGRKQISNEDVIYKDRHFHTADITQGRMLNKYERASYHIGDYSVVVGVSAEQGEENEALAREFVWEHWRRRKRGYLLLTWHGIDFASTGHYFIEPNPSGAWRIIYRGVSAHSLPPPSLPPHLSDVPEIVAVEFVGDELRDGRKRKRARKLDPRSYSLVLKDKDGNVVGKL